jgi:predicted type IV restriction endonuclease
VSVDIKRPLKKFLPHLLHAKAENLNEADTVMRIVKVFEDVLGYSAMTEITRESNIKDKYVDLAIKIDGTIRLLVEVKSAGTVLRDRHIEQAERYAAEGNHRWVVLTNGTAWNLYHLTFADGIEYAKLFTIDLSDEDGFEGASACLGLIHRQSVKKGILDDHWAHRVAMNPASIAKALFSEEVLRLIRRDIKKREEISVDEEDLADALHAMMSGEAREQMGPLRIRRKRKTLQKSMPVVLHDQVESDQSETDN